MASPDTVAFPVFGDLHLGFDEEAWENASGALRDSIQFGPDLLVFAGDVVDIEERHWPLYERLQRANPGLPCLVARGNADFTAGADDQWESHIGHPLRTILDVGHVRLVVLGGRSADHQMPLGEDASQWLTERARERPDATVVLISHAPVKDTTFWSCDNTEAGCLARLLPEDSPPYHLYLAQSDEIEQAIADSPNLSAVLTGHVHNDHRMVCDHGYGPTAIKDGVVHMVTANLGGWQGFGVDRQEYRWLEIDRESIHVRVRDFVGATWVKELEATYPLRKA